MTPLYGLKPGYYNLILLLAVILMGLSSDVGYKGVGGWLSPNCPIPKIKALFEFLDDINFSQIVLYL